MWDSFIEEGEKPHYERFADPGHLIESAEKKHALEALGESQLFRDQFGSIFIDYYLALKQAELSRYSNYVKAHSADDAGNGVCQPPRSITLSSGLPCSNRSSTAPTLNE